MKLPSSMGKVAAGGAAYIGASQALRVVLTLVSTVIVARLLTPDDYGVMAMAAPVTAFLLLFQNMGLSHAAIQARTLTDAQSNALFWLNMAASAAIMVILLGLSPLVAWFYGDPRPGYITAASGATVLLSGSTIQHMALLNRELRFRTVSGIDMAMSAVSFVATIAAAAWLRSYWALWLGPFVGVAVARSLMWKASRFRPALKVSFAGTRKLVTFGGSIMGFNLLNFLNRNLDNVLIGKVWGTSALGLYDRSYKLMMFPVQNINSPLSRVMLPLLSRLRSEPDRFRRSFLLTMRAIMLASVPAIAVAGALSDRLIPFLLGAQWTAAAPIFRWLSLAALLQPIGNATGWLFITSGASRALLKWGAFSSVTTIIAFSIGVRWGPVGVALAYFAVTALRLPVVFAWSVRATPVRARDLYWVCLPPFAAAGLAWVAAGWLAHHLPMLALLATSLFLSYAVAVALHWLDPGGREAVRTLIGLIGERLRRRRATPG